MSVAEPVIVRGIEAGGLGRLNTCFWVGEEMTVSGAPVPLPTWKDEAMTGATCWPVASCASALMV